MLFTAHYKLINATLKQKIVAWILINIQMNSTITAWSARDMQITHLWFY